MIVDLQEEKLRREKGGQKPPRIENNLNNWKPFEIKPRAFYLSQEHQAGD